MQIKFIMNNQKEYTYTIGSAFSIRLNENADNSITCKIRNEEYDKIGSKLVSTGYREIKDIIIGSTEFRNIKYKQSEYYIHPAIENGKLVEDISITFMKEVSNE